MSSSDPSYTVFIRLPFKRGNFLDPPAVEWDATKDKALWKILSKASKNSDIDWSELAAKFGVSLAFLLQQAAWLYERQLVQVRAQMRKVGVGKGSAAPSPVPLGSTSENVGGEMMRRTASGGAGPKASSALSSRKDSPLPRGDIMPNTPSSRAMAPPFSKTSSTNTAINSRNLPPASNRPAHATINRRSLSPQPKSRPVSMAIEPPARSPQPKPLSSPPTSPSDSSSSDSEPPVQSRLLRRPPRFTTKHGPSEDGEASDDEPAFMPFTSPEPTHQDPSATLRGDSRNVFRRGLNPYRKSMEIAQQSQTSDSSTSSTAPITRRLVTREGSGRQMLTGPLSPRRTAELQGRSPISKGKGREGSDGTPSMGSSFSDLDDASVTQSALEEALASNMQAGGGMASRMSSISQALRSKYL